MLCGIGNKIGVAGLGFSGCQQCCVLDNSGDEDPQSPEHEAGIDEVLDWIGPVAPMFVFRGELAFCRLHGAVVEATISDGFSGELTPPPEHRL